MRLLTSDCSNREGNLKLFVDETSPAPLQYSRMETPTAGPGSSYDALQFLSLPLSLIAVACRGRLLLEIGRNRATLAAV